jgi:Chlorophyll A-B binding protein
MNPERVGLTVLFPCTHFFVLLRICTHSPFGFAGADKATLLYMREAEIKHSRLAMLAVVGWPLAELWDQSIATAIGLPTALTKSGSSPSLLNGGLEKIDIAYWAAVVLLAGVVEIESSKVQEAKGKDYLPGDCGFDPLNVFPTTSEGRMAMMTKEIKHGRLAMMAIVGFAVQEALYRTPVVAETPMFFKPMF